MKIIKTETLALTVELDPTDCIALALACEHTQQLGIERAPVQHIQALGCAFTLALAAISDPHMDDEPLTIAKVWRAWAPLIFLGPHHYGRVPVPKDYAD